MAWRLRTTTLSLARPLLMGVLNVTPDSFSDGGAFINPEAAIAHGRALSEAGADLVDVGGESTRPGADPVDAPTERARILTVVEALATEGVVVSVDTSKPEVASAALGAGAEVLNDITAGRAHGMLEVAAESGCGLVLMHMRGTPRDMQQDPQYGDVVAEICSFLVERAEAAGRAGVAADRIALDPGIGFGKTVAHNLALLDRLGELVAAGYPVVVGASRKSFLAAVTGAGPATDRDSATAAVTALAVARGAAVIRVHDITRSLESAQVAWAIVRGEDAWHA